MKFQKSKESKKAQKTKTPVYVATNYRTDVTRIEPTRAEVIITQS